MRIVIALGRLAVARPVWTILGVLIVSATLAGFVPQAVDDAVAAVRDQARERIPPEFSVLVDELVRPGESATRALARVWTAGQPPESVSRRPAAAR